MLLPIMLVDGLATRLDRKRALVGLGLALVRQECVSKPILHSSLASTVVAVMEGDGATFR